MFTLSNALLPINVFNFPFGSLIGNFLGLKSHMMKERKAKVSPVTTPAPIWEFLSPSKRDYPIYSELLQRNQDFTKTIYRCGKYIFFIDITTKLRGCLLSFLGICRSAVVPAIFIIIFFVKAALPLTLIESGFYPTYFRKTCSASAGCLTI